MEDQFGGRTDDDLFADDFEPVPAAQSVSVPISAVPSHSLQPAPVVANTTVAPPVQPSEASPKPQHHASDARILPATDSDSTSTPARHPSASPPKSVATSQQATPPPSRPIHRSMLNSRHAPKNQPVRPQVDTQTQQVEGPSQTPPPRHQGRGPKRHPKKASRDANTSATEGSEGPSPGTTPAVAAKPDPPKAVARLDPGTRLASGGMPRAKLTEQELSAKMEKMRLFNQERARRHEAAEQDEKAHAEALARGQEEARKRRLEEIERRKRSEEERKKLEDEREKNRARKLKAMGMKEGGWDEGKEDLMEQVEGPKRSFRGAHGGIRSARGQGLAGSKFANAPAPEEDSSDAGPGESGFVTRGRGRGRGGRGRGRGRGGFDRNGDRDDNNGHHYQNGNTPASQHPPKQHQEKPKLTAEDFPALPSAPKPDDKAKPAIPKFGGLGPLSPLSPIGKWDEEVENDAVARH